MVPMAIPKGESYIKEEVTEFRTGQDRVHSNEFKRQIQAGSNREK